MNRVAKTLIAITTLMFSIACPKAESFEEIDISMLPQMDYCELRNSADRYDGKSVKIRAQIANFGHGYYFDDERCSKKVSESLLDDDKTAVRFFGPRAEELSDALKQVGFDGKPTSVVAVGRFTRQFPTSHTDLMSDRTSFHFELFSIEQLLGSAKRQASTKKTADSDRQS